MTDAQEQIKGLLQQILAATGGGGGAAWGGITGTIGDQTDLANALALKQTEAQVNALIAAAAPYLVYTALLTQSGTDAPVATVLLNTLGGEVVWTYVTVGEYRGTLADAFPEGRVTGHSGFIEPPTGAIRSYVAGRGNSDSRCSVITKVTEFVTDNLVSTGTDGLLGNTFIELHVYPAAP